MYLKTIKTDYLKVKSIPYLGLLEMLFLSRCLFTIHISSYYLLLYLQLKFDFVTRLTGELMSKRIN